MTLFLHSSNLSYVTIAVPKSYRKIWKMLSKSCPSLMLFKP